MSTLPDEKKEKRDFSAEREEEQSWEQHHLINQSSNVTESINSSSPTTQYRVFPVRWLMLVALVVLNISNGMMWLSYSPVPSITADFYHITLPEVDWFSQSYFVASLAVGFLAIAVLDVCGLRLSIFIGVLLNLFGSIIRYVSTLHPVVCSSVFGDSGYMVALIGQILTACAQPFFLYSPTKLANTWFGPNQRALCTLLASMANPIGIAAAQLISPRIATTVDGIPTLMWIYIIPAAVGAVLSVGFYRDRPRVPPSSSGDCKQEKFFKGLKNTVTNWSFLMLLVAWGVAAGMFNAFLIVIPQYLCPYGYSNQEVGLWGSLMIFCGLVGAIIAGVILDFTKKFKETGVVSMTLAAFSIIWFIEVGTIENNPAVVAIPLCFIGFFGMAMLPVCMELGVEVTYPVAEATSSGLLWSVAQIFGIIFVSIGQLLTVDLVPESLSHNKCGIGIGSSNQTYCGANVTSDVGPSDSSKPENWTNAGILFLAAVFVGHVLFTLFFYPQYKRLAVEKEAKDTKT